MNQRRQRGVSLVEVMVGMVAGLVLVGGIIAVFLQTKRSFSYDEKVVQLSDEGRFAASILAHDIALTGFWARVLDPLSISYDETAGFEILNSTNPGSTIGSDCGAPVNQTIGGVSETLAWGYHVRQPLDHYDDADGGVDTKFPCFGSGEVKPGTDVISIKRVSTAPLALGDPHRDNQVYLRANGNEGGLFRFDSTGATPTLWNPDPAPGGTVEDWAYTPRVYFIRSYSRTVGDNIPTLCHKELQTGSPPSFATQCLAEGIEDLQLEFGIDTSNDGTANYYDPNPDATEIGQVTAVRLYLLARSIEEQTGAGGGITYHLGKDQLGDDKEYTPADGYLRRLYVKTILTRNPQRLRELL